MDAATNFVGCVWGTGNNTMNKLVFFFLIPGGNYKCNKFESMEESQKNASQNIIDKEKSKLEKYIFYFDRF